MRNTIGYFDGYTTVMERFLVERTPVNTAADLIQYVSQIDAAYDSAYAVYNKNTVN